MSIFKKFTGQKCLIRSYGSGVHVGTVKDAEQNGERFAVILENARRIHYWEGACSCSQIAIDGISSGHVSVQVPEIGISDGIECIPLSENAVLNLENQPVWKSEK